MSVQVSARELLDGGIRALAHGDAAQLEYLVDAAQTVRPPEAVDERKIAQERLRTLGHLIVLTRRNLRLLRGAGCGMYENPASGERGWKFAAKPSET
jgi:hypothetical protein